MPAARSRYRKTSSRVICSLPHARLTVEFQGGTILGTARSEEFRMTEGRARAIANMQKHGIEGLILVGGDGTFKGGTFLSQESGIAIIGVPGTIDNDCYGTDYTIGFDTAVNTALEAIDRIRDTAESHNRLFFVEVMGRHTGFIALESGLAGGAEELMIPEVPMDVATLSEHLRSYFEGGKRSAIVVIAFTMNKELFPVKIAGTATGLINLFPFAGGAVFQPFLGYILGKHVATGNVFTLAGYKAAFLFLFFSAIISFIAVLFSKETMKKNDARFR